MGRINWRGEQPKAPELKVHQGDKGKRRVNCGRCTQEEGFCWHQCRRKYAGSLRQRRAMFDLFAPSDGLVFDPMKGDKK